VASRLPFPAARALLAGLAALTLVVVSAGRAPAAPPAAAPNLPEVMFVGNNWDGTVDVIRSSGTYAKLGRINVVPDKDQRMFEINIDPVRLVFFLNIRSGPGEGHDQLVDDMYSTPDGTALVVSRPSFADVVSIDLRTGALRWPGDGMGAILDPDALPGQIAGLLRLIGSLGVVESDQVAIGVGT
jgi:hypothetical protein